MQSENKTETKKFLRWFLIGRFLITMLCIFVSEQLIGLFYSRIMIPGMSMLLIRQQISVAAKGNPVVLILQMLLYICTSFLPDGIGGYIQRIVGSQLGTSLQIVVDSPFFSGSQGILLRILVIAVFLALIFVSVLPYLAGAFY